MVGASGAPQRPKNTHESSMGRVRLEDLEDNGGKATMQDQRQINN